MKKTKVLKYLLVFPLFLILFYFLEINVSEEISYLPFEITVFALVADTLIFKPGSRRIFIVIANMLFLLMMLFFVLNRMNFANIAGSLGFGILILTAVSYLQRLFKQGHL